MVPIFLLLALTFVQSLNPGAKMNIHEFVFTQLSDYIIPLIDKKLNNVTINNYTKKIPFFEVNFTHAYYTVDPIRPDQVTITYKNQSSKLEVKAYAIEGQISFDIDYDLAKIKDHIHCDAYLKYMYIDSTITNEISRSGNPAVKVSAKLHMEPFRAQLVFTGGTTAKLLEILEPIIKVFLVEATDLSINYNLHKWIADELDAILSTFIVDFKITDQLYVNYELPSVSSYWNDSLEVPLSGYVYTVGKKYPPTNSPFPIPKYDESMSHTVQFLISDYLLNSALTQSFDNNILNLSFSYDIISPMQMNLSCNASKVPHIILQDPNSQAELPFSCNVSAYNRTDDTTTLFEMFGNLSFVVEFILDPSAVKFYIYQVNIKDLQFQKPEEFDVNWLIQGSNDLALYAAQLINFSYLSYGIPFPTMNHTTPINYTGKLYNHNLGIFSNVTFQ